MKRLLFGAGSAAIGLGALIAFAPGRAELVRETTIAARPSEVHALLEDLRRWGTWSPWHASGASFSGAERGVDARASWESARGPCALVVTASDPARGVWYDIRLATGGATGRAELPAKGVFQYAEVAGGTRVVWSNAAELEGARERVLGYALERWLGVDLEAGLADLKQVLEAPRAAQGSP